MSKTPTNPFVRHSAKSWLIFVGPAVVVGVALADLGVGLVRAPVAIGCLALCGYVVTRNGDLLRHFGTAALVAVGAALFPVLEHLLPAEWAATSSVLLFFAWLFACITALLSTAWLFATSKAAEVGP